VGIEIPIQRLLDKWKTNQNRPEHDKLGVVAGLRGKMSKYQMQWQRW